MKEARVPGSRSPSSLASALALALVGVACQGQPEAPPVRPQSLGGPKWEARGPGIGSGGPLEDALTPPPTAAPTEAPTPRYKGVMAQAVAVWEETRHQLRRQRAVEQAFAEMTDQDVQEAFAAVVAGRRPDAEVGIALLTLHFTRIEAWRLLEDAYRQLFRSAPELSTDPLYLLEHALSLLKLERYREALTEVGAAETHFRGLPTGRQTLAHRARVAECRAWATEGLARQSEALGTSDADLRQLDLQALRAWEGYVALVRQLPSDTPGLEERLTQSLDHLQYLRESIAIAEGGL